MQELDRRVNELTREISALPKHTAEIEKKLEIHTRKLLGEIEEILGRTVLVKSDPLLHQEKFDLA